MEGARQRDVPPLLEAVVHRHLDMVQLLLEAGAHYDGDAWFPTHTTCNVQNQDHHDPHDAPSSLLGVAVDRGFVDVARLLLDHGVRPDSRPPGTPTPLMMAVWGGKTQLARLLVHYGASLQKIGRRRDFRGILPKPRWTPLHHAAQAGTEPCVRALAETAQSQTRGHPVFREDDVKTNFDSDHVHPLYLAVHAGHAPILIHLAPHATSYSLGYALHLAVERSDAACTRAILKHGRIQQVASALARDSYHALLGAAQRDAVDVVRALLEAGALPTLLLEAYAASYEARPILAKALFRTYVPTSTGLCADTWRIVMQFVGGPCRSPSLAYG